MIGCLPRTGKSNMIFLSTVTLFVLLGSVESSETNHGVFSSDNDSTFNHLVIDKYHGFVFVGGVNRLYQLNENLSLIVKYENGPRYDSPECPIEGNCSATKNSTNNYNKALVVDNSTEHLRLISCGSIFQGLCLVHNNISNITSEVVQINISVVANDAASSTVAFIGPGPTNWSSIVLYVAATITNNSFYRADMPLIASRSLETDRLLKIAVNNVDSGTQLMLLPGSRYIVNYVYGFSSGSFTYFLTNQIKSDGSFVSKLARICNEDHKYYSYTEIPITCTSVKDGKDYNLAQAAFVTGLDFEYSKLLGLNTNLSGDVLFVAFSQSKNDESNYTSAPSALCVYSLKEINVIFLQNIRKCIATGGNRGLENIVKENHCTYMNMSEEITKDDFCKLDFDIQLEGNMSVTGVPLITNDSFILTAVAAAAMDTPNHMMLFLGTNKGHLKKIIVKNPLNPIEIDDIYIDDSPVSPDILFDLKMIHLYAMTKTKLIKVKIHECSKYETCSSCLAIDPECGWCLLQQACTSKITCTNGLSDKVSWIDPQNGSCYSIISMKPTNVSSTTSNNLEIMVANLPNLSDQLQCIFTFYNKTLITNATHDTNVTGTHCYTPEPHLLSSLWPVDQYNITTKLSLKTTSHPEFVSTNITFFNCSAYNLCTACISSQFPCNWCSTKHQCVYRRNLTSNLILTGENCDSLNDCSGIECCPLINSTSDGKYNIIISNGETKGITFNIVTGYIKRETFSCRFSIEGEEMAVSAILHNNNTLQCNEIEFGYPQLKENSTVTFEVLWGEQRRLDNPNNVQLIVYKCAEMSPNCNSCSRLENKYQCGWCKNTDQCEIRSQCENGSGVWLDQNSMCPNPNITFIEPACGLWNDQVNITIRGTNLGLKIDEDRNITVADIPCIEFKYLTRKSHTEIVCQVNHTASESAPSIGRIKIEARSYSVNSEQNFTFLDPEITDIFPIQGPKSGGTELTIKGQYLNLNVCKSDFLGVVINNIDCNVTYKSSSVVMCRTGKSNNSGDGKMTVIFGSSGKVRKDREFYYADDPIIKNIEELKPKGIPAGGIKIHVRGKNFESIQKPLFYVYNVNKTKRFNGTCYAYDDSIICSTPQIPDYWDVYIDPDKPKFLDYGFEMDGVGSVQNISTKNSLWFLLYPNPTFHSGDRKYDPDYDKTISIDGENIADGLKSEISVKIGNDNCVIETLKKNLLICRLPEQNFTKGPKMIDDYPEIVISVGSLITTIGKLVKDPRTKWYMYPIYFCAVIVALSILLILAVSYRKSSKTSRNLKKIRKEMDELELVVSKESRSAFTNLQTEITDLTTNITFGGIPFLDYCTYTINIMFPGKDHSAILAEKSEFIEKKEGLRLFGQLINNKTFLLMFIQVLESNNNFSMNDRVYFSSMIMIMLQNNMEYCTDILKTLLAQLIEKSMKSGRHPKLLLRQSESVVEKMLSIWFTFLLYKFLKKRAGEPLYKLFAAIKQYVNKGPIDAITCEARHALSEDRIIRQHIGEYKTMNLYVSVPPQTAVITGLELTVDDMPIEVLDCDTISQVKDKAIEVIYCNLRYSARPSSSQMELEWLIDEFSVKFLSDDDESSKVEGEWRQQNTLQHYEVPDGSTFNLVLVKNRSVHNATTLSATTIRKSRKCSSDMWKSKVFSGASWKSIKSRSLQGHAKGVNYKLWHLSKPIDYTGTNTYKNKRNDKMVSEIYLTRLLATKLVLQKFVDDLFEVIFDAKLESYGVPPAIKYIFDFLDNQALQHGITDSDVVHTWKSNCLPLRFWINLIKNPNFLFDIHKSNIVDSCLGVIAQAFMDSCSTSEHHLSEDSPTTKLLYAKDIPVNKNKIKQYYADIKSLPTISDQDMNAILNKESHLHASEFNINSSLYALHEYAVKYDDQLMVSLMEDEFAQDQKLALKLEKARYLIRPILIDL